MRVVRCGPLSFLHHLQDSRVSQHLVIGDLVRDIHWMTMHHSAGIPLLIERRWHMIPYTSILLQRNTAGFVQVGLKLARLALRIKSKGLNGASGSSLAGPPANRTYRASTHRPTMGQQRHQVLDQKISSCVTGDLLLSLAVTRTCAAPLVFRARAQSGTNLPRGRARSRGAHEQCTGHTLEYTLEPECPQV